MTKAAGHSEYYIAEKFKKELHISVADFVKQKRIEQAKLLLCSTR